MGTQVWCGSVIEALSARDAPATIFFRDDDVGWAESQLWSMLACFERHSVPVDLAVIPAAFDEAQAKRLRRVSDDDVGFVGLHQHGYAHSNHEIEGRKCEFGSARTREQQQSDIAAGWTLLEDRLDGRLDRFFTPPWNRCTQATVDSLQSLGFEVLSRDVSAKPLQFTALRELPVAVDWLKRVDGERIDPARLDAMLAHSLGANAPVGIMLHHEHMDGVQIEMLDQLLGVLVGHRNCRCRLMREVLDDTSVGTH